MLKVINRLHTKKAGFTLIELLVVIAIIAILAAILFPVFAQAREKARAITCVSNQKELGLAFMMYVEDYDETFPMDQYDLYDPGGVPDDNSLVFWTDFVYPYIKNGDRGLNSLDGQVTTWGTSGIYDCPSYPQPYYGVTYGGRYALMPDGLWSLTAGTVLTPPATLAQIQTPSDSVMLCELGVNDAQWTYGMFDDYEGAWTNSVGNPPGSEDDHLDLLYGDCDANAAQIAAGNGTWDGCGTYPRYRHTMTTNLVFCDGHVKSRPRGSLLWYRDIYLPGLQPTPF